MKDKQVIGESQAQIKELRQALTKIEKLNVEQAVKEIANEPAIRGRIFEAAAILRRLSR